MKKGGLFFSLAVFFLCLFLAGSTSASGEKLTCHAFEKKFIVSTKYDKARNSTAVKVTLERSFSEKIIFRETMSGLVEAKIAPCLLDNTYDGIILSRQTWKNLLEFAVFKPTKDELEIAFPWRKFPGGKIFVQDQEVMLFCGVRFSILFLNEKGFLEFEFPPINVIDEGTAIKDTLLRFKLNSLGEIEFSSVNLSKGTLRVKKGGDLLFIRGDLDGEVEKIEFFADDPRKTESNLCEAPRPDIRRNFKGESGLKMTIEIGMKTVIIPIKVVE